MVKADVREGAARRKRSAADAAPGGKRVVVRCCFDILLVLMVPVLVFRIMLLWCCRLVYLWAGA